MNRLAFVDTHVHFWDLKHPDLRWVWLDPEFDHPQLGPHSKKLQGSNYVAQDFIAETRSANVTKVVHVQAAIGSEDTVKESQWLQESADRIGLPHAIIAYCNLKKPDVEDELARHVECPNVRGIRDFSDGDYLVDPDFQRGYGLLEKFGLVSSFNVEWEEMIKMRDLAIRFPNITAVLDHCGFPKQRTAEYFKNWRESVTALAEADNVVCKISGLGMVDWNWTIESIKPWVMHCIDAFGPERCIFATNWPVDKLFSTYEELIEAYSQLIEDYTEEEKVAMFSGNAEKLYRI